MTGLIIYFCSLFSSRNMCGEAIGSAATACDGPGLFGVCCIRGGEEEEEQRPRVQMLKTDNGGKHIAKRRKIPA